MHSVKIRFVGTPETHEAIALVEWSQPLTIEKTDAGQLRFLDQNGNLIGTVTHRHKVAKLIAEGMLVHECMTGNFFRAHEGLPHGSVNIRVDLLEPGEEPPKPQPSIRDYPVGLVGESFCQPAIRKCRVGEPVVLWHQTDNPHDDLAIAVSRINGDRIGYISRDSWLRDAIHRDQQGASAFVLGLNSGRHGIGVVLQVSLGGPPISRIKTAEADQSAPRKSWFARIFGL